MFLKKLNRSQTSPRISTRDQDGSTLIGVVGLIAIAGIIVAIVATSTVQAMGQTSAARAGVQAQAAADAGVEFARALIKAGNCQTEVDRNYGDIYSSAELDGMGVSEAAPFFEATVQHRQLLGLSGGWADGCPPSLLGVLNLSYELRIQSTGYAASPGVAGVSAFDEHTVEAGFGWNLLSIEQPSGTIFPSGAAVYAHSSDGFAGSGTLLPVNGSAPGVLIREGNVHCDGASAGIVDLVAAGGNVSVSGSCKIDGNLWAAGSATVNGGTGVAGHIISNGATITRPVGGSIWSSGAVTLDWNSSVGGSVTSRALVANGSSIGGNVYATGNVTANQTTFGSGVNATGDLSFTQLTLDGRSVGKKLTLNGGVNLIGDADVYGRAEATTGHANTARNVTAASINFTGGNTITGIRTIRPGNSVPAAAMVPNAATPTSPVVPEWIDFRYDKNDWDGFTEVTMSGTCDASQLRNKLAAASGAVVVNALGCNNKGLVLGGSEKVDLDRNVAIIADKFDLGGSAGFRSTTDSRLWLVTPDTITPLLGLFTPKPDCRSAQNFALGGAFSFADTISTMIYTPCKVQLASSTVLKGQIYAGKATIAGAAQLKYVKVGLPGINLDTGEDGGGILPGLPLPLPELGTLGEQKYYRDLPEPTVG